MVKYGDMSCKIIQFFLNLLKESGDLNIRFDKQALC